VDIMRRESVGDRRVESTYTRDRSPLVAASANATTGDIFGQAPSLDNWGVQGAVPADKTCDVACSPPQSRTAAAASPGTDQWTVLVRITEVEVLAVPPNRVYWIQVFNDTGTGDDWFWLGGLESYDWPPDCCWPNYGYATVIDTSHAPGEVWEPLATLPLAFKSWTTYVGAAQGLRLSKLSDEELLLEWEGDCGGGADFSVYRGDLQAGYSSLAPEPDLCDVSGTSATLPVGLGAADFFLVAPWVEAPYGSCTIFANEHCRAQGSYGAESDEVGRPQPANRCYWETSSRHDCAP